VSAAWATGSRLQSSAAQLHASSVLADRARLPDGEEAGMAKAGWVLDGIGFMFVAPGGIAPPHRT